MASPIELSTSESVALHSTVVTNASTATASYSEQAWHILALLFSIGRPARPSELASRCTLFYMTPNLVEFLCSLPNSPIELTRSYFVTFSSVGCVAIANLAKNSDIWENLDFVPRFLGELGFMRRRGVGEQAFRTYCRKKSRMNLDGKCLPVVRKRSILNKLDAQHEYTIISEFACRTDTSAGKAYFSDSNISKTIAAWPNESPHISINEWEPDRAMLRTESSLSPGNAMFTSGVGSAQSSNAVEPTLVGRIGSRGLFGAESGGCQLKCPNNKLYLLALEAQQQIMEAIPEEKVTCLTNPQSHVTSTTAELKDDDHGTMMEVMEMSEKACEYPPQSSCCAEFPTKNPVTDATGKEVPPEDTTQDNAANGPRKMIISGDKSSRTPLKSQETLTNPVIPIRRKQQAKSFPKPTLDQKDAKSERMKLIAKTLDYGNDTHSLEKQQQLKKYKKSLPLYPSSPRNTDQNRYSQPKIEGTKKHGQSSSTLAPNQLQQKVLPDFESFVAEEEEGSGGYGTVYRARRKNDGSAFAIKCPHVNANKNHVRNELKMLERFGGKNFIIKYEGSFKDGDSDCLVLEHVEHDRPEVLKREIDVSELQWYGYSLFRALASLHKQGIIHRDVKPGNFLFNRKACKGYLIDFNLALDLHQKQGRTEKKRVSQDASLSFTKSLPPTKSRKIQTSKALHLEHHEQGKVPKFALQPKKSKNESEHPKPNNKGGNWSIIKSQGADGSGITSAKDTSTMTLSGEKRKEPIPSHGRKELLSLVQEAFQGANQKEVNGPVTKRKRVEAPAQVVDRKIIYQTPMPLHSAGVAVGGAGLLESKGNGKHNREGPCVGTKGFRAPEVLFRSLYQSPKVDIWSAGVTLLYLITGRSPFTGEPDQNVKEIAKLRGSEDLWEVAKLHGHESLFPQDLLDVKSLASTKLHDWCKVHTRRPDFLHVIPRSLLDLVDKCLTVNPRLRISAEDALKHDFFAPCHEALRKHRLHRQGVGQDISRNPPSQVESQISTEV